MKTSYRNGIRLLFGVLLFLAVNRSLAFQPPAREELPNLDLRPKTAVTTAGGQNAAFASLPVLAPGLRVQIGAGPHAKWIHAERGFLPRAGGGGGVAAAMATATNEAYLPTKTYVQENAALFGFGPEVLEAGRIKREFVTPHNGLRTVVWEQELEGISIFESVFISHTTQHGELVNVASQFVPAPAQAADARARGWAATRQTPTISAAQAVTLAARNIGEELEESGVNLVGAAMPGAEQKQLFAAAPLAGPAEARLVWLPFDETALRLCWDVGLSSRARGEMYRMLVEVETGEVLIRQRLTEYISDATYRIFSSDSPSPLSPSCATPCTTQPPVQPPVLVTLSALNTNASPNGWIDDGGNETRGNNVDAHTDRDANNSPDLPRPQGSPFRTFDFPVDLSQSPLTYSQAAVTDLFYWCNWMHDRLYALGFTEAAGNFQNNNFGRGGLGNDALQADAQDGSGVNNANMSTPSDGSPPRMQMFLFTDPNPDRDGDFDHEIVLHEYTHGLSNRRVGGGVGLSALQSRGMGEGWSDWYGLALLSEPGDDVNGVYAAGGYATYQMSGLAENYYFGIRRYPYSTDLTKNPLTFRDIDPAQASTHPGVPRSTIIGNIADAVHNQGEVWCVTLWGARANLIAKHGYAVGNELILRLVTDGMNLAPANPNFLQARDAILQADLVNNGGANLPELWAAFARRGMGYSATSPSSSTTTGVVEAYDVPDNLVVSPGAGFTGIGPVGGPFSPGSVNFALVNIGTNAVNWSAAASATWLTLSPGSGSVAPGNSNQISVTVNAAANLLSAGVYNNTVRFTNVSSGVVHSRVVTLRVGQPDYFTELFDGGDNDLDNQTLTFTPDGSGTYYSVCREPAPGFPTDPTGGVNIPLAAHTFTTLTLTSSVSIYGITASTIYLASEGHLTLLSGDSSGTMTLVNHFSRPRVSASLAHIHPTENGGTVSWRQLANRVAITFNRVVEYATTRTNSFQIELFYDGRIRMTHLQCATMTGLVGLSAGTGLPGDFQESDLSGYGGCALPLVVSGPTNAIEGAGVLAGLVNILTPTATNLTVTLSTSDPTELTVPTTVTILAGGTSTNFNVTVQDDGELDGAQLALITATAPGYVQANGPVSVADNETATLSLDLPPGVTEGSNSVAGTVRASAAPTANITVNLSSSDLTELQVPATVTLLAGQTAVGFNATIVNDTQIDGSQLVAVTATVPNWTTGLTNLVVQDNESTNLLVTLPVSAREGEGLLPGAGTVMISGTLPTNLVVALGSGDLTELTVLPSATIFAGLTTAAFNLMVVNDPDIDSAQVVSVTASASGFASGVANMTITDDESPPEPFNPFPAHLATNVIQTVDLFWQSGALPGEVITNDVYFGIAATPGPMELLGSTTNTNWTLPTLAPLTTYYWKIVARKAGVTPSPVWQFATRGVDHFVWDPVSSPQFVNEPFAVTVTAKDAYGTTVSNFTGNVHLTAEADGGSVTNTILPSPLHTTTSSGSFTLAYAITPTTNLTVTHVRSYSGTKVSIWSNGGTLLRSQNVSGPTGTWTDTPLANPLVLTAGTTYRVSFYTGGGTYYYRSDRPATFPNGTLVNGYYYSSLDAFPDTFYNSDSVIFLCDLRYTVDAKQGVPITPVDSAPFANGTWTGNLLAFAPASNVLLRADDGAAHTGDSSPLEIGLHNDVAVTIADAPDPVSLGGNLTYTVTVTNIGPASASEVTVTNILPDTVALISVATTQGAVVTNGNLVVCTLNTLGGSASATISIVVNATSIGTLTNQVLVSRSGVDPYPVNNSASAITSVQPPVIAINDVTLYEGNGGLVQAAFVVTVAPPPALVTSVNFATANGSAVAPGDFVATNGLLTFLPGQTNQTITVLVVGDTAYEYDEMFSLDLSGATNASLADFQGVATIRNDDSLPMISISDATVLEGNLGATSAVFTVTLSKASGLDVTVYFSSTSGSATTGSDFAAASGYLVLAPGVTSTNVAVTIMGDLQIESDEVFYVNLYSAANALLLKREGYGLIGNDDGLFGNVDHFVWSSIASPQRVNHPFGVTITARDAFNNPAVNFNGTAQLGAGPAAGGAITVGNDTITPSFPMNTSYQDARTQVIYPAGELGGADRLTALALDVAGIPGLTLSNWTIRIRHTPLSSYSSYGWESTGWTVVYQTNLTVTAEGWLTFQFTHPFDYDGTNSLMIDFSFNNPAYSGAGYCRSTAQGSTRTIYYHDYGAYGDPLTWSGTTPAPNVSSYTPNLRIFRATESATVQPLVTGLFTNGVWSGELTVGDPATNLVLHADDGNGHVGDSAAFAVALHNDVAVSVTDAPDPLALGAQVTYSVLVTNTGPTVATGVAVINMLPPDVTLVSVAASQGTYLVMDGMVLCALGTLTGTQAATLTMVVTADVLGTHTNLAILVRAEADNYLPNNSATNTTIVSIPELVVHAASGPEPAGTPINLNFDVSLSVASPQVVTVNYATANGTALAGTDYVATNGLLTFGPGQTNATVRVAVLDDAVSEPNEFFSMVLSAPTNAVLGQASALGTIIDNDGPPDFQILNLFATNSRVVDHDALTGDDRGGIAISSSRVFVTGDSATARFNAADLTGGASLGMVRDSLCTDLRTETVYLLGNGSTPLTSSGGTVSTLIELNATTGLPTGTLVTLSQSFTMTPSSCGIFSGFGRVVVYNGTRVHDIYLPTGIVHDRGTMTRPAWHSSESWSIWGVAEYFGGALYLTYRDSTSSRIVRARVSDGAVTVVATFSNLSDLASFVVSPSRNRWYFHYEGSGQFGGSSETLGYADAQFSVVSTNPPVIVTPPDNQTVMVGGAASFSVTALSGSPLGYQWLRNGSPMPGATLASVTITNCQLSDSGSQFSCLVSNVYGVTPSTAATLTVWEAGAFLDDFDPTIDLFQWSAFGGAVGSTVLATNYGGAVSSPNSLWFGAGSSRFATSRALDVTSGGVLNFALRIASGASSTWEMADLPGEGIVLEYSTNSAIGWVEFGRYDTIAYTSWTNISAVIPTAARTVNTQFRWRQLSHSGIGFDHWALDDVAAFTGPSGPTIVTQPANQTVPLGSPAGFAVTVSGSTPLTYQWRKAGTNLVEDARFSGTKSNFLTILNVQTNDAGLYSVLVTNAVGAALSSNATLMVTVPLPPPPPCCPTPTNGATVVSVHTILSWDGAAIAGLTGPVWSGETIGRLSFMQNGVEIPEGIWIEEPVLTAPATSSIPAQLATTLINFDDLVAPCSFISTTRLTTRYALQGVTFAGPGGNDGGAILNQCGMFGVVGISPPNFLAFNSTSTLSDGGIPRGPETLYFTAPVSVVRMSVGSSSVQNMTLQAYNASNVVVSTTNVTLGTALLPVTLSGAGITRVVVSSAASVFVIDDLSFDSGGGLDTYDVYLGTNPAALSLLASNLPQATYTPDTLAFDTTYYWQVVAANAAGRATGAVWQFTTTRDEIHLAAANYSVAENGGLATITVARDNPTGGALNVQYTSTNGTAIAGLDYTPASGTLQIPAGVMHTNFQVPILNDSASEGAETILLSLSLTASNVLLTTPSSAVLTIVDDDAAQVSLFADPLYVDTGSTVSGEVTNLTAALMAKGYWVQRFTGITPAAFSNALSGAGILLIPELETSDLATALTAATKSVISNFVAGGGSLIINGEMGTRDESFVNQVFGYSIGSAASSSATLLTSAAAGTAFAGGQSTLPENNGTYEWLRSSLPAGSLSIYQDSGGFYTTVAVIPRGAGKIVFLGYDWFDAVPRGTQDGGWDEILRRALLEARPVAAAVPPAITTQPQSQVVSMGSPATFSVSASGNVPLRYQWRKGNAPISGATNSSYTMNFVQYSNAGSYSVVVSNAHGFTNSGAATLTVTPYDTNLGIYAFDTGWYDASGAHFPGLANYNCGDISSGAIPLFRNWFAFHIPNLPGPILTAQLRVNTYNIRSPTGGETYQLRHVSTPVATLVAGAASLTAYHDLADGVVYGSRFFSTNDANQFVTMDLNAALITNLMAAAGQPLAIGGEIASLDGSLFNDEFIFGGSAGLSNDVQLLLTLGIPVPPLKLLPPEFSAGQIRLRISAGDDSPITPGRASNIWVYATTNITLPLSNWTALAIPPVFTNGMLVVAGINPTNPPAQFFRAIEGSWNVGPLRLHLRALGDGTAGLQARGGDGAPLTPIRAAKIRFYASTNMALSFNAWQPLARPPVFSNGMVEVLGLALTNAPAWYFRAEELP